MTEITLNAIISEEQLVQKVHGHQIKETKGRERKKKKDFLKEF